MCLGALLNAGIGTLVLGARLSELGQAAFMFKDYSVERFAEMTGWELEVIGGVMSAECAALYADPELRVTR